MKILLSLGIIFFALSFCNLADKFTGSSKSDAPSEVTTNSDADADDSKTETDAPTESDDEVEKAKLTSEQEEILKSADEVKWDEQGMLFLMPKGWNKVSENRTMINYGTPAKGFFIVSISPMSPDFPTETSLKANYDGAVNRMKNGQLKSVQYTEIDGIKGVEFVESSPEEGDMRRHQWIAFRKYAGGVQMINVISTAKGGSLEENTDTNTAMLYSMKMTQE